MYSATVTPLNVTTWLKTVTPLCSSPDVGAEVGFKFCADVGAAVGVAAGGLAVGAEVGEGVEAAVGAPEGALLCAAVSWQVCPV